MYVTPNLAEYPSCPVEEEERDNKKKETRRSSVFRASRSLELGEREETRLTLVVIGESPSEVGLDGDTFGDLKEGREERRSARESSERATRGRERLLPRRPPNSFDSSLEASSGSFPRPVDLELTLRAIWSQ